VLDETGGEVVAQIVPTKVADPGALEQLSPALLKSRHYIKDAGAGASDMSSCRAHRVEGRSLSGLR
jgi:hypothetical protein